MTWASRTFAYILHFKQLVSATDHRRHQNRNFRDKISCSLCTTFLSLPIFLFSMIYCLSSTLNWDSLVSSQKVLTVEFGGNYFSVSLQIQVLYLQIHLLQIKTSISFVTFHYVMATAKLWCKPFFICFIMYYLNNSYMNMCVTRGVIVIRKWSACSEIGMCGRQLSKREA